MSVDLAIDLLATCESILVFTGAGISTESGIPDFRGPDGVWSTVDPADFTIDRFLNDRSVRERSWQLRARSGVLDATPNDGHRAITRMWESGLLIGCVTQNIDGLHAAAGLPEEALIEIHGNARMSTCVECGTDENTSSVVHRVDGGETDPRCGECGGIVKADVVMFGEGMPAAAMTRAMAWAAVCDAVLAVGSTLSVYPAAYIPLTAAEAGAPLIIVNQGPTDLDKMARVRIDGPAGEVVPALATALSH